MDDHELAAHVIGHEPFGLAVHLEQGRNGLAAGEAQDGEAAVVADFARLEGSVALDRIGQIPPALDGALGQLQTDQTGFGGFRSPGQGRFGGGPLFGRVAEADLVDGPRAAPGSELEGVVADFPGAFGDDQEIGRGVALAGLQEQHRALGRHLPGDAVADGRVADGLVRRAPGATCRTFRATPWRAISRWMRWRRSGPQSGTARS